MNLLTNALAFTFALGVIIFIHEMGHLLAARLFNVRVLTFSLGFGKRLFGFQSGDTDYRVSLIPLGGYVKMSGELPEESTDDDPRDFMNKPRWQRIIIYAAGPAMNFVLAVALVAWVFMVGIEMPNVGKLPPVVGGVLEGSPAETAGLVRGDRILAIDGEEIADWQQVMMIEVASPEKELAVDYVRDGQRLSTTLVPDRVPRQEFGSAGFFAPGRVVLRSVDPNGAAAEAGLQPEDQIVAVDGRQIAKMEDFIEAVSSRPGETLDLQLFRDGRRMTLAVTPRDNGEGRGLVAVSLTESFYQKYPPMTAVVESFHYTVGFATQTFQVLGKLFTREIEAKTALSGPIDIAAISGSQARRGFSYLLHLMGLISISIGIVNLLPIPILDGGQIVILTVESILRRDLSLKVKDRLAQVGFVVIMLIMVSVLIFDLQKNLPPGLLPGGD